MSGLMETLVEKADALIAVLTENNRLRAAENGGAAPAAEKKPAAKKAAAAAATSTHTADEVKAKFEEIKATDTATRVPTLKKIIADQGATNLTELMTMTDKLDATFDALVAFETELSAGGADEDDL